ncbi:hypothetical protein C0995_009331 [Termitomyces sp. Mi166|nr:hypothetical protein C0995_009331 [Termitomyces sp. Mi166\
MDGNGAGEGEEARQVEKKRMREMQNINKSLSALEDVAALEEKGAGGPRAKEKHVPYRNSKFYVLEPLTTCSAYE